MKSKRTVSHKFDHKNNTSGGISRVSSSLGVENHWQFRPSAVVVFVTLLCRSQTMDEDSGNEEMEFVTDDEGVEEGDAAMQEEGDGDSGEGEEVVAPKVFVPGKQDMPVCNNEELVMDDSAYLMYHQAQTDAQPSKAACPLHQTPKRLEARRAICSPPKKQETESEIPTEKRKCKRLLNKAMLGIFRELGAIISRLGCGGSNTNKTVCNSLLELMTVSAQLGFNSWGFNNSMHRYLQKKSIQVGPCSRRSSVLQSQ
ncbi:hypothetical protein CAPTEDRAFT_209472 [Capitella teleta]|uniref:Uncharacterized protein n=1 Tax=Capitella teleta TaxID=283909 RepID=R7U8J7_CAPTE|nr:hypothetical protein CAPTEDRAFT_209472 [Capitella teleta]|eukprot:ELU02309.1 hypothetical protein CAPTEDRAFT_209472 [Capitella teleta]